MSVDLTALEALLASARPPTGLPMVAVMLANNETGIVQPVAEVAQARSGVRRCSRRRCGAGGGPHCRSSIEDLGADFLIVSSHKIGGPKGAGALIARGEILMPAALIRGGGQEKGHRSGTENPAAIAGFGAAARSRRRRSSRCAMSDRCGIARSIWRAR